MAEAFDVVGRPSDYEPGDVLVVSTAYDRTIERSATPYSDRVAGVLATRPGLLLTEGPVEDIAGKVPMGVVGVLPTKVSAEGGAIRRGDLLVTASRPGHAMRGDAERVRPGQVLGKALEEFARPGTGSIRVLVSLR